MVEKRFEICPASELDPGDRRIATLDGFSVGVFNVDGEYYAMKNDCPHQRAPLCEGKFGGTTVSDRPGEYDWVKDGQIARCPWHGWEFDVTTGESVFNPHRVKAKTFETAIEMTEEHDESASASADGGENSVGDAEGVKTTDGGCADCGVTLQGEEPPVETYDVEVEEGTVVVYL